MDNTFLSLLKDDMATMLTEMSSPVRSQYISSSTALSRQHSRDQVEHLRPRQQESQVTVSNALLGLKVPILKDRGVADSNGRADKAYAKRYLEAARHETKMKKTQRHDRKTMCGECGLKAAEGKKLQMCSRCK